MSIRIIPRRMMSRQLYVTVVVLVVDRVVDSRVGTTATTTAMKRTGDNSYNEIVA
jgi:hypothetical protein